MRDKKDASRTSNAEIHPRFGFAARLMTMAVAMAFLVACGGGGSDGTPTTDSGSATISALSMPDRISITSVDDGDDSASTQSVASPSKSIRSASAVRAFDDPGTDYDNQRKDVWVEDTEALGLVNDILGVVQDTGYENYVNQDPYKALVQKVGDSEQSASGSSTTATTTEQLMEITVEVTRASNTAPMIVKVWVLEEDGPGGAAMLIRGYFSVTEGVSADYPYGQMDAHFVGVKLDETGAETDTEVMHMAIKVDADDDGKVVVQCVDEGQEGDETTTEQFSWNNSFRLVSNADLSEGQAYVNSYEAYRHPGGEGDDSYTGCIAYNNDYFKEQDADTDDVTVYDKNSMHHKVYRYKLFEADSGDKVAMSGGFPITLETGEYGYIGYWGLWVNDGVTVENGDVVTNMDGDAFTVFTVGGKLRKHTRTQVTLAELTDVEMSMWDSNSGVDYIIAWNGSAFVKTGYRNNETGQVEYGEYGPVDFNEWDGAWCESLNAFMGLGRLYADGMPAVTDATVFSFHTEETIDPSTAQNWTFYYWGPLDGDHETYWGSNPTAATELAFDAANLVLMNGATELVDTDSEYGTWISPLTTVEYTQETQWQAHDADTYYSWSTGPNQWDQYTSLKDANGAFVSFDQPLHFAYVHSTANDLNGNTAHDGMTFNLDYDGSELHIPWNFDSDLDEWQPMFSLKDGTILADGEGNAYVVKGIEVGVVMREAVHPEDAASLVIDETISAPDLVYDPSKTALVGEKPDAELRVIRGESI